MIDDRSIIYRLHLLIRVLSLQLMVSLVLFTFNFLMRSEFSSRKLRLCGCLLTGALHPWCRVQERYDLFLFHVRERSVTFAPPGTSPSPSLGY